MDLPANFDAISFLAQTEAAEARVSYILFDFRMTMLGGFHAGCYWNALGCLLLWDYGKVHGISARTSNRYARPSSLSLDQ